MIKAALFDADGTILDTNEYIYQAFEHSLGIHGHNLTRSEIAHIMGKPLDVCYRILTSRENVASYSTAHSNFQLNNSHLSKAYPNAISTLKALKKNRVKVAVITTRSIKSVPSTLKEAELMPFIDNVICFENVTKPKPDPEGINKALKYFGVSPEQAIMVGDSPDDVLAGKNAGTKTIGATYGFHGERIRDEMPDFVVDDIGDILQYL